MRLCDFVKVAFHDSMVGPEIAVIRTFSLMLLYRPTVIVGLFIQQAIALFVLKSGAGFSIFNWIATLAADFLNPIQSGSGLLL